MQQALNEYVNIWKTISLHNRFFKVISHLSVAPRLRKRGTIPPLTHSSMSGA